MLMLLDFSAPGRTAEKRRSMRWMSREMLIFGSTKAREAAVERNE